MACSFALSEPCLKKTTKQTKQRHKEVFTFKKSNTTLLLPFQGVLKTAQTLEFQWSKSQTGPWSGNQVPEWRAWPADSEAGSSLSAFWGHCWRARCPGITGNLLVTPPHPSALQMLVVFFWPVEFLRQGKGGKYIVFSRVPVPQAFPSKIPWRVKPDIGMATYSERNSLNIETVLLMHFKEATL